MAKNKDRLLSPLLVLYTVNINQPCSLEDICVAISTSAPYSGIPEPRLREDLEEIIEQLRKTNLVYSAGDGRLVLTYLGLKSLSEKKIGYPRDKYRLYYLKDRLKDRGQ